MWVAKYCFNNYEIKHNSPFDVLLHEITVLPLNYNASCPTNKSLLPLPHVNCIYRFVPHVIYSLWICAFAITKFTNKILRNQIQYRYISTQVVSGWVMPSDIYDYDYGDCQLKLALSVTLSEL